MACHKLAEALGLPLLTHLSPSADFAGIAMASRHCGRKVIPPEAFCEALAEAAAHVQAGRGLALLDRRVERD